MYFLCAVHYQDPGEEGQERARPKLRNAKKAPLARWDSLYYALVAEVRSLYAELQTRFGEDFGGANANFLLHNFGVNGNSNRNKPFTALRLASELENFWKELMDHRLVAALDKAVREAHAQEKTTTAVGQSDNDDEHLAATVDSEGLVDVTEMSPKQIMDMLRSKHVPEIERMAKEDSENKTFLSMRRAEVREAGYRSSSESSGSDSLACTCDDDCDCHVDCSLQPNECVCTHVRNQLQQLVDNNLKLSQGVRSGLGLSPVYQEHLFGTMMNEMSQMIVAAQATSSPYMAQASRITHEDAAHDDTQTLKQYRSMNEAATNHDTQTLNQYRHRANTADSDLAYVPPLKTPSRGAKQAYPLNFYGEHSGHRYPAFPNKQDNPPPVFSALTQDNQVPARKPVPPPVVPPPIAPPPLTAPSRALEYPQAPTPETSPTLPQHLSHPSQVTHPSITVSHSRSTSTRDSSPTIASSVRKVSKSTDTSVTAEAYRNLVDEAHALSLIHI